MVLEVLPISENGKGSALTAVTRHFHAKSMLVMGDDATDAAMFRVARTFETEGVTTLLVGISGGQETPPEIEELADTMLNSTNEAREALEVIARALGV